MQSMLIRFFFFGLLVSILSPQTLSAKPTIADRFFEGALHKRLLVAESCAMEAALRGHQADFKSDAEALDRAIQIVDAQNALADCPAKARLKQLKDASAQQKVQVLHLGQKGQVRAFLSQWANQIDTEYAKDRRPLQIRFRYPPTAGNFLAPPLIALAAFQIEASSPGIWNDSVYQLPLLLGSYLFTKNLYRTFSSYSNKEKMVLVTGITLGTVLAPWLVTPDWAAAHKPFMHTLAATFGSMALVHAFALSISDSISQFFQKLDDVAHAPLPPTPVPSYARRFQTDLQGASSGDAYFNTFAWITRRNGPPFYADVLIFAGSEAEGEEPFLLITGSEIPPTTP